MSELAELYESVLAQAELGGWEVPLDEPWMPARKNAASAPAHAPTPAPAPKIPVAQPRPAPAPAAPRPAAPQASPAAPQSPSLNLHSLLSAAPAAPASADDTAWERAKDLEALHQCLATHPLYQEYCDGQIIPGQGPVGTPCMLLFHSPSPVDLMEQSVASGAPGELLANVLASVKVNRADCYATYFFKGLAPARLLPRQLALLRRMLLAEIALLRPGMILCFGPRTYQQAMEGQGDFLAEAGKPSSLGGVRATALIDPADMLDNKELKLLTWKQHLPRCGFFTK